MIFRMDNTISVDRVREVLDYDEHNGILRWRIKLSPHIEIGSIAKNPMKGGYLRVGIDGKRYLVHRICWLHFYGTWPTKGIDHINGDSADNRISNLREATQSQNLHNRPAQKNNSHGFKGVSYDKRRCNWYARIKVAGKQHYLGRFNTAEQAFLEYQNAADRLLGTFYRT